jgi:hypothetical protein
MTTYGVRIFDLSVGGVVFSAPSAATPQRAGQVAAGAMATPVRRDRRREDLKSRPFVAEGTGCRPMDPFERSAGDTAVEKFAEELRVA